MIVCMIQPKTVEYVPYWRKTDLAGLSADFSSRGLLSRSTLDISQPSQHAANYTEKEEVVESLFTITISFDSSMEDFMWSPSRFQPWPIAFFTVYQWF